MESNEREAEIKETVNEALDQFEKIKRIDPSMREMSEEACIKILSGQLTPKEALKVNDDFIEKFYSQGYRLFQAGKYDEALLHFDFLRKIDPANYRYSFSIAACYHYKKEYLYAAGNYIVAANIDDRNPIPYFHLSDCFIQLHDLRNALGAIEFVILIASEDERYSTLKEKALLEKKYIEAELTKEASRA